MSTTMPDPDGLSSRADLAAALTTLREQAGLTVRELARRLDARPATLGGYFSGRHLPPTGQQAILTRLLRECGVTDPDTVRAWVAAINRVRSRTDRRTRDTRPPFRGLDSYDVEDAALFYGRTHETARLLDLVREHPMVAVIGPSGSGKSSVLRAGLLAAARAGDLDDGEHRCACVVVTPGTAPLDRLAEAIAQLPADGPRVLVVDQLEELFTSEHEVEERQLFLRRLAERDPGVVVVFGLRADFYAAAAREPSLQPPLQDAQLLVGPMSPERVRETILGPAREVGLDLENGFVDVVLTDLGPAGLVADTQAVSSLPLLAHALLATWERSAGGRLTIADYRATGGIEAAIERTAETVFAELTPTGRHAARSLFLRLVTVGDLAVTRRRVPWSELGDMADVDPVARTFVSARLLTASSDGIEMSHEALLTAWPRLREWLEDDRDGLRLRRRVTDAAADWERSDRDPAVLLRGARLEAAAEWAGSTAPTLGATALERDYIDAGLALAAAERDSERRAQRRVRGALVAVAVLAVVALGLAVVSYVAERAAQDSQRAATASRDDALSRQVAEQSVELADSDPALAEQLAVISYRIAPTDEARSALVAQSAHPVVTRVLGAIGPTALAVSADGRTVAVSHADDGSVHLYRYLAGAPPSAVGTVPGAGGDSQIFALAFSPDAHLLVTGGQSRTLTVWDVTDPSRARRTAVLDPGFVGAVESVAFSPDGRTLVAGGQGPHPVRRWAVSPDDPQPRPLPVPGGLATGTIQAVAFNTSGTQLAAAGLGGVLKLWSAASPAATPVTLRTDSTSNVYSLAFAPDGKQLYAGESGGTIAVWSTSGRPRRPAHSLAGATSSRMNALAVSPDGSRLSAGGSDNTLESWNTSTWQAQDITHNPGPVTGVRYTPDGSAVLSTAADGVLRVVRPDSGALPIDGSAFALSFSKNGTRLAIGTSGSPQGNVQVWDVRRRGSPVPLTGRLRFADGGAVAGTAALRPDGRLLAAGDATGRLQLWTLGQDGLPHALPILQAAPALIESLSFSPSGRLLAVASDAGDLSLYDVRDPARPRRVARVRGHDLMLGVAFSPDGRFVAGANADRHAYVWNIENPTRPRLAARLSGFASYVYGIAFSPTGSLLAATSSDHTSLVWHVEGDGRFVRREPRLIGPTSDVYSASFDRTGRSLAVGSIDGTARIYDLDRSTGVPARTLTVEGGPVFTTAYDPVTGALYAGGGGATVASWTTDPARYATSVCPLVGSPITRAEWSLYVPGAAYDPPCR